MAPRGLKSALRKSAPAKLTGSGKFKAFRCVRDGRPEGPNLRGLTKALENQLYSDGELPAAALHGATPRGGWRGRGGGRRRGAAVDAQLSRLINAGKTRPAARQYSLTRLTLAALAEHGLEPVLAQRAVCSARQRLGTACDIIAYEKGDGRLVVVELKCGFSGDKTAAAQRDGAPRRMRPPLRSCADCVLHRHLAQLAVTRELLLQEKDLAKLQALGVASEVDGALLYVDDDGTSLYPLGEWWKARAPRLLDAL